MSEQDQFYTMEQTSHLLGISAQKLRRWDEQGVLGAQRTEGGHRRYPREVIDRLVAANSGSAIAEKTSRELASVKRTLAEKRRIIQLLIESEGRYRDLVETSHDLIWQTDAEGRFIYLNSAAHEIFGLAPHDLIGNVAEPELGALLVAHAGQRAHRLGDHERNGDHLQRR